MFNLFAECVGKAPTLVLSQPSYVTKVVFPLEVLSSRGGGAAVSMHVPVWWCWLLFS